MKNDPDSNTTNNAYDAYITAKKSLEKFKTSFSSFKASIANAAPVSESDSSSCSCYLWFTFFAIKRRLSLEIGSGCL